nr:hypothetical protein [Micromonospora sp. DSM 115978]
MGLALRTSPLGLPLGGGKPRVETHTEYSDSFGPEAAALMEAAGRPLDPWQLDAVTLMLAFRDDGQWQYFECCEFVPRQNGKGAILEARALCGFLLLGEELIMWSAHEYKTAMEAFRRVKALIKALGAEINENLYDIDGILVKVINTNGEESFERLDTGARIKFVARSKGSGRGFSADCNIIDEAFAYSAAHQAALLFTLSARPNPQVIYTSSPPLTGESGEIMFDLRLRGDPTAPRGEDDPPWEQEPSLSYRDWGHAGVMEMLDGVDLDDLAAWAAANPGLGIRLTHEQTGRERRAMRGMPGDFARERLGIWPRRAGVGARWQVISENAWLARLDRTVRMLDPVVLAVDVIPGDRTWAAIAAAGPGDGGGRVVDVIDHRPGTGWVIARLQELARKHRPMAIIVSDRALRDAAEEADAQAAARGDDLRLNVLLAGAGDMAGSSARFYDGVAGRDEAARDIWHLGQGSLTAAVAGATKRTIGDGWGWNRRDLATDICPLVAVSLAIWALGTPRLHTRVGNQPFAIT